MSSAASRSSPIARTCSVAAIALTVTTAFDAAAHDFSASPSLSVLCSTGGEDELRNDLHLHAHHTAMMDDKFRHIWFGGGRGRHEPVSLEGVYAHLASLAPRRVAVLFQARHADRLCTWLVWSDGFASDVAQAREETLADLRPRLLRALRVHDLLRGRAPTPTRGTTVPRPTGPAEPPAEVLRQASRLLVPDRIAAELSSRQIDTLVIVPSADVGTFPFAALPVRLPPRKEGRPVVERPLVEIAAIAVAPGFDAFMRPPSPTARPFDRAVIVGNPRYPRDRDYTLPDLPGAEAEAKEVASLVSGKALVGKEATVRRVRALLSAPAQPPKLVYLATHGLSDADNPLDGSRLWLDERWSAREMSRMPLGDGRPLVVLSACQTALGKTFDVGTIGLARAWMKAGASRVVMSLWRVDDAATKALMTRFLELARSSPVERALQQAMLETRGTFEDEAQWASFAVMGLPEPGYR